MIGKLACKLFGHKWKVIQLYGEDIWITSCKRCKAFPRTRYNITMELPFIIKYMEILDDENLMVVNDSSICYIVNFKNKTFNEISDK